MENFLSKEIIANLELLCRDLELEYITDTKVIAMQRIHVTKDIGNLYTETYLTRITAKSFLIFDDAFRGRDDVESILFLWDILSCVFSIMPVDKKLTALSNLDYIGCMIDFFPHIANTWELEAEHFNYLENIMDHLLKKVFKNGIIHEAGKSFLKKGINILYTQDSWFSEFPEDSDITELL